jgi:hypothetical protein
MNCTDPETHVHPLAETFSARVVEAERILLSAGLWDPPGLHEHACEHGLAGWHFVLPEHSYVFAYLCLSVENDHVPSDSEAVKLAKVAGVGLDPGDLRYIVATDHDPRLWSEYVETVRENGEQFKRASECFSEGGTILTGLLADQFDVVIRPRRTSSTQHRTEAA